MPDHIPVEPIPQHGPTLNLKALHEKSEEEILIDDQKFDAVIMAMNQLQQVRSITVSGIVL